MSHYEIVINEKQRQIITEALKCYADVNDFAATDPEKQEETEILSEMFDTDLIAADYDVPAHERVLNGLCY